MNDKYYYKCYFSVNKLIQYNRWMIIILTVQLFHDDFMNSVDVSQRSLNALCINV